MNVEIISPVDRASAARGRDCIFSNLWEACLDRHIIHPRQWHLPGCGGIWWKGCMHMLWVVHANGAIMAT